jgi:hypothetical protein
MHPAGRGSSSITATSSATAWLGGVRECVGGEEGWPPYLQRFAALVAERG